MVGSVPARARLRLESPSETPDPGEDEKNPKKILGKIWRIGWKFPTFAAATRKRATRKEIFERFTYTTSKYKY